MRILLATTNPHKLQEITAILPGDDRLQWVTLNDLPQAPAEPAEDQPSFEANALLKARYYAQACGLMTLADDSGLQVDALGGQPGVRSARYAAVTGPRPVVDQANNDLLLRNLQHVPAPRRTARFVCAMALVDGDFEHVVRGLFEGCILGPDQSPRGEHGFGYDPLFLVPAEGCTSAQLTPDRKNELSHRGAAVRLIQPILQERLRRRA